MTRPVPRHTHTRGRLLVAEPTLGDPNFHRTVVLMIEHNPDGALGLVLNRPSPVKVVDVVPQWSPFVTDPDVVFVGGPVSPDSALALGRRPRDGADEVPGWQPLFSGLGAVDLHADPGDLPGDVGDLRVFAGYAGWSPGQLDSELEQGGWNVVDAEATDVFADQTLDLWKAVLLRQPGQVRRLAFFPADPTVN